MAKIAFSKGIVPLLLCTLLILSCASAQNRGITLQVGVPFPTEDTFLTNYDGIFALGLVYTQPTVFSIQLRPAVEFERFTLEGAGTDINQLTFGLGLGYAVALSSRLRVVPEIGVGLTRLGFDVPAEFDVSLDSQSGFLSWVAVEPTYKMLERMSLGISLAYRTAFLEAPEPFNGISGDTAFNKRTHVLQVAGGVMYHF
ncbi:MAG: hypothetical protein AAGI71_08330 [Bacteroidota bacterium]